MSNARNLANLLGTGTTVADAKIAGLTASKLTGALPAISGSNLTGVSFSASDFPSGSIVKTGFGEITDFGNIALNSSSNVDISGTEKSFTRTFSNSKILILLNLKITGYQYTYIYLNRKIGSGSYAQVGNGATGTSNGRTSVGGVLGSLYNNTNTNAMGYGIHAQMYAYLDSSSVGLTDSTDAISYKITGFSNASNNMFLNTTGYNNSNANRTTRCGYTFMEIRA